MSKWWQTIKTSWTDLLAYRANFFLQVIGPALVFYIIKVNLWTRIYENNVGTIQGFSLNQMLTYHLWVMAVALLCQSSHSAQLSEDIRMGRISSYLVYPFNLWEYHTAQFMAFQGLQYVVVTCLLTVGVLSGILVLTTKAFLLGFLFSLFVALFWFCVQYLLGLFSFWMEETWVLRVIFMMASQFLSGSLMPLDIFPKWWQDVLYSTPFPYLTYYPVKIFMGEIQDITPGIIALGGWFIVLVPLVAFVWKRGLRMYTAAGM